MYCPNCAQEMESRVVDYQLVLHCPNCGGSFFEENGINRISLDSARTLANERKGDFILGNHKLCPKDDTPLTITANIEALPPNVTIYKCSMCSSTFAYPEDLVRFKEGQSAKITFFKLWGTPLPSLQSVMIMGFMVLVGVSLFAGYLGLKDRQTTSTQAQDVLTFVSTTKDSTGRLLFVVFKTSVPYRSRINFIDTTNNTVDTKVVSDTFTTLHQLTTSSINLEHPIEYEIILIDKNGNELKIKKQPLTLK